LAPSAGRIHDPKTEYFGRAFRFTLTKREKVGIGAPFLEGWLMKVSAEDRLDRRFKRLAAFEDVLERAEVGLWKDGFQFL